MNTRTRTRTAAATAALALAALAGCAPIDTTTTTPAPAGPAAESDNVDTGGTAQRGTATNPLPFGGTATWEQGLSVTIATPQPYEPSAMAAGASGHDTSVSFAVTVRNGSSEVYKPIMMMLSVQSGHAPATRIYDVGRLQSLPPSSVVSPGRPVTFEVAFNVADPDDVVVSVKPGFEFKRAYFAAGGAR